MGKDHRGYPSGANKSESETGIPTRMEPENRPNDEAMTEKYTNDDQTVADNVRTGHPNRNTDKGENPGPPYS
ncbi:hypothetical protein [Flaviaesturariibacter amylovorans]|uniref:Uncharacterized protein n=1 Tax=Flaviaesturariibacter amylovorans TaxID=1084520 RepID=A0ABP8HDL3_9BACT